VLDASIARGTDIHNLSSLEALSTFFALSVSSLKRGPTLDAAEICQLHGRFEGELNGQPTAARAREQQPRAEARQVARWPGSDPRAVISRGYSGDHYGLCWGNGAQSLRRSRGDVPVASDFDGFLQGAVFKVSRSTWEPPASVLTGFEIIFGVFDRSP
jgi:hypothetical protein